MITNSPSTMNGFAERLIEQRVQQGEARRLIRLLSGKFGELPVATLAADADTLLRWSVRLLPAERLEEVPDRSVGHGTVAGARQ